MRTYRAGIVGCGWVSTAHMNGYRATGRVDVTAAADTSKEAREAFGVEWEVASLYSDYREMLDKEKLDLVSICTGALLHVEMVREAAARGVRVVVCEKPLALSLGEADAMLDACGSAGCHLVVCHQRRFEARYVKARDLLRSGAIGEVRFVRTWGGDIFEGSDHVVDLMRYFVEDAPVRRVAGQVEFADPPAQLYGHLSERSGLGYVEFTTGVSGLLCTSELAPDDLLYGFAILGTEGVLEISGVNFPAPSWVRLKGRDQAGWQHLDVPNRLAASPRQTLLARGSIEYFWLDCWQRLMESVVHTAETGEEGPCSGASARADLEVLIAVHASSRLRQVIEFPVQVMDSPVALDAAARDRDSIWNRP